MCSLIFLSILISSYISYVVGGGSRPFYPPDDLFMPKKDAYKKWNISIQITNDRNNLFSQLFSDFTNLEIEILASFKTWSESPLYYERLNSILFSSPSDRNLYSYSLTTQKTTLLLAEAGNWAGQYNRQIPLSQLTEAGPAGLATGLNLQFNGINLNNYVFMTQLALGRVIAFDPTNIVPSQVITIANVFNNLNLNSPQGITITSNGQTIYFTDPTFGLQRVGDIGFFQSFSRSSLGFAGVYRIDIADILNGNTQPKLVIAGIDGPNGIAVTNNGQFLIISNTGNENGFAPYWNVYRILNNGNRYQFIKRINYIMSDYPFNAFQSGVPLADGLKILNDQILLAIGPNGIYIIDLFNFEIIGRIRINHLISNIEIKDNWLYCTSLNHLFRIKLTPKINLYPPKIWSKPPKFGKGKGWAK